MKCSYCSRELPKGQGIMYVYKIGNVSYYCSGRCYKSDIIVHRKINSKEIAGRAKGRN